MLEELLMVLLKSMSSKANSQEKSVERYYHVKLDYWVVHCGDNSEDYN